MKAALFVAVYFFLLFSVALAFGKAPEPAVVIVCSKGGIVRHGFLLVNAADCVGHDKYGGSFSSDRLAVYEDLSGGSW